MKFHHLLLVILLGCASVQNGTNNLLGLTEERMLDRSKIVSNVKYGLSLDLVSNSKIYQGVSTINFDLKDTDDLTVDFSGGKVEQVSINKKSAKFKYDDHVIHLDEDYFQKGNNEIVITYSHAYSTNSEGFYRFEDPQDNKSYVYTDFEPYKANELFPCFDQPNLKATYTLTVRAPKDWTIITYDYAKNVTKTDNYNTWSFGESAPFSTYILEVSGGPYTEWNSFYLGANGRKVPMKLYARASVAKYVDANNWFSITKQGMKFFEKFFKQQYPFNKYDQILVPDFNWGGMENVAAVTYNEDRYVFRSTPTDNQKLNRANVILHELAHMWFGDLVTMDWWNGLWLNESFATVMANIALEEATEFKGVWQSFFTKTKGWAYWTDQLVTTHPIETEVRDTNTAFSNFDGITYGKGASVLKQLRHLLGDKFEEGIGLYFQRHAYKNTKIEDFFQAMEDASGIELDSWVDEWVKEQGLNTVSAQYDCKEGLIENFWLVQGASQYNKTLRTHKTKVGLFGKREGKLVSYKIVDVTYKGEKTLVTELRGASCPVMVYPNVGDFDYVKVVLDEKTLETTKKEIRLIKNSFARQMMWTSLYDMVLDARFSAKSFYVLARGEVSNEKNYKIKTYLMDILYRRMPSYIYYADENFKMYEDELAALAWKNLNDAKPGSDFQKEWFQAFLKMANDQNDLDKLARILSLRKTIPGLKLGQDLRWEIIITLNRRGYQLADKVLSAEEVKDTSATAQKLKVAAEVARPTLELKKKWYQEFVAKNETKSLAIMGQAMENMFPVEQAKFKRDFEQNFFKDLVPLAAFKQAHFLETYTESLVPSLCTKDSVKRLKDFINDNEDKLPGSVVKTLKISNQENQRCVDVVGLLNKEHPLNKVQ